MAAVKLLTIDATNTVIKIRGGVGGMYKHVAHKLRMEALSTTPAALIDSSFKNSFRLHWSKAPNFGYGKMTVSIADVNRLPVSGIDIFTHQFAFVVWAKSNFGFCNQY